MLPPVDATTFWHLTIATLGGAALGVERQRSGHAEGPHARFAGVRTFTLIGLGAGLGGWLWVTGFQLLAAILLGGFVALTIVAYARASATDVDGTTEVAAIVAITSGALAGAGAPALASGIYAITVLLLVEKTQLHGLVRLLDADDIRAGARFAVMAAVVLPLLPEGPYGPAGTVRPRLLWTLVLFFSGLSFVGVIARRLVGAGRGYVLAGFVGGLLSSTSVTLTYARLSSAHPSAGRSLAAGTMGANAVLLPRVLFATMFLAPPLARVLWLPFVAPFAIAVGLALRGLSVADTPDSAAPARNPLQFRAALEMAAVFQVVLFSVAFANAWFGDAGLYGSAAVLGLADVDALTVSMADRVAKGAGIEVAGTAITIGVLSNTLVKLAIALSVGRGHFRTLAAVGLGAMALALGASLLLR